MSCCAEMWFRGARSGCARGRGLERRRVPAGRARFRHGDYSRWREFCHFADVPSPVLLKHLLQVEGGAAE